jgi:hypothetical protein
MLPRTRKVVELAAAGFDENLQIVGGDPYGGRSAVGIRIPTLATPNPQSRYLVLLSSFSIPEGQRAVIRGYRQLVTLGVIQNADSGAGAAPRVIEQLVTSPFWAFPDGNISWHLQNLGAAPGASTTQSLAGAVPTPSSSFAFRWASGGAALLYETATIPVGGLYVDLTAYTPPNQGQPQGRSLRAGTNATFYGQQTDYLDHGAWGSLDIDVEGPKTVGFFASVGQSNPGTRPTVTVPGTFYQNGLSDEELFLLNFPSAVYWRVGGSLIVEMGLDPNAPSP